MPKTPQQVRNLAVRVSLALTGIATLALLAVSQNAALGFLFGGLAGTAGFWMLARKVEQLAEMSPLEVQAKALKWSFVRLVIYGLALWQAYLLDTERFHGLAGATAGILIIRLVMLFLAVGAVRRGAPQDAGSESESDSSRT